MRPMRERWLASLLAGALVLAGGLPAGAQKSFTETTEVVAIEIPVNVTQDGEPVRGLTVDNFEVVDGRRKQEIVAFDVIDLTVTPPEEQAALHEPIPAAGRRHFLLLFDTTFADPAALTRAREAAMDLVKTGLHPEDLAAVAVYSVQHGPVLILGFTPDRAQLELALETLGSPQLIRRVNDPLRLVLADPGVTAGGVASASRPAKADVSAAVEGYLQSTFTSVGTTDRKVMEDQVRSMTRQMADLARLLDSVEGRKYVVLLSEGFDDSLLVGEGAGLASGPRSGGGISSGDITDRATGDNPADSIASGDLANVRSDEIYGSGQVQNALQRMLQEFRRANCTIQAVDIGGLRAGGSVRQESSGANALSQMASETGGEVFRNFNDLSLAMNRMLEKTSVTYLLVIQPEKLKLDGKYHELKVRLKDVPRGVEIQHRPGYYAPLPLKDQSPLERQMRTAGRLLGEEGGGISTAVLATPFQTGESRAYVPLLIEVDGASLVLGSSSSEVLPVEVYAYALDSVGGVHDFFTHTLPLDLGQIGDALRQSGLKYYGHLDLKPGEYTVRVLVRNLETGLSTLDVLPLEVPDVSHGRPVVLPPLFPEPMGKWVMVREGQERQRNVPYPFMLKEQPYIPAAAPVVGRKGQETVPVVAYNLTQGPVEVKARLLGADGQQQGGCEVVGIERFLTSLPGAQTLLLDVKHSGLDPGEYTLEVEVTDPASGQQTVSSTPVVVSSKA